MRTLPRLPVDLDRKAWRLLQAIQADGRASIKSLAAVVGISITATAERLQRLQASGVIRSIEATIDPVKAGYGVTAFIGICAGPSQHHRMLETLELMPEVLECHQVAGSDSFVAYVVARDLHDLQRLLEPLNEYGQARTSIVLSTPIRKRGLAPP